MFFYSIYWKQSIITLTINTIMAKKELTVSEFRAIIREEALKLKKRMVLENEKKALQAELRKLMSESYGEEEMEENWLGDAGRAIGRGIKSFANTTQGGEDMFMNDLQVKTGSLAKLTGKRLSPMERDELIAQATEDSFGGRLEITPRGPEGRLVYVSSNDADDRSGSVVSIGR